MKQQSCRCAPLYRHRQPVLAGLIEQCCFINWINKVKIDETALPASWIDIFCVLRAVAVVMLCSAHHHRIQGDIQLKYWIIQYRNDWTTSFHHYCYCCQCVPVPALMLRRWTSTVDAQYPANNSKFPATVSARSRELIILVELPSAAVCTTRKNVSSRERSPHRDTNSTSTSKLNGTNLTADSISHTNYHCSKPCLV